MNTPGPLFDARLGRLRRARSRALFAGGDFLHRRVVADLADRAIALSPDRALACDLGGRRGLLRAALDERGWSTPTRRLIVAGRDGNGEPGADLVADPEQPPFADRAFDLVLSPLALHWANDLVGALARIRLALRPGGPMVAALIGGASLTELRQALIGAEAELAGGAGPRVAPMLDAAVAPTLLRRAGFADPVVEVERLTVRYPDLLGLMRDLRAMGETNVMPEGARRPMTGALLARAQALYAEAFAGPDGRLPASFEIITLTGWAKDGAAQSQSRSQATSGPSAGGIG